ncbi:hypothetical protein ACQ4M3_07705 [Leptolyngbya sp. AN03gr2]|uniref:hypothetical protein n=1 Tax=unclassified Leptolyngbya TaxID=2650499 RepID=UPI003D31CA57
MVLHSFTDCFSQLTNLGFMVGSEIWLKLAWDQAPELCPLDWKWRNEEPEQIVLTGIVLNNDLDLNQCKWAGYDINGDSIWEPQVEPYSFLRIAELAHTGATVHFYPNQPCGGISNNHVTHSSIVFYEIDQLDLQDQWKQIYRLTFETGLSPCAVVYTGSKSLHVYFRLSEPVESEVHWRRLARKLCILQDADNKVTNPARAMRLAGIARRKHSNGVWQEPVLQSLEQWSRHQYSPEAFEHALDQTGRFPLGLSDERWMEWVSKRNQQIKGEDVNPEVTLTDPSVEVRFQERKSGSNPTNYPHYDSRRTDAWVKDALDFIPRRSAGENTYETYRTLLIALKNHYGEETAISLMEEHSPSRQCGWNIRQVCRSSKATYSIGSFFHLAEQDFGWKRPATELSILAIASSPPPNFDPEAEIANLDIEPDDELQALLRSHSEQVVWNALAAFQVSKSPIKHPLSWLKQAITHGWKPKYQT